jgi:hypothetical protein
LLIRKLLCNGLGDCVILRQVLQHLSNAEIQSILNKIKFFKWLVLTEHIPIGDFVANLDIISGQGTRLKKQSGIDITKEPFNLIFKMKKEIFSYHLNDGKSKIVSILFELT